MKRIGVLTSGGDAPGMNAAIRAVVRKGIYSGLEVWGIERGYEGLLVGDAAPMDLHSVAGIIHRGGTILKTSRSERFKTPEGQAEALRSIEKLGLDGLIVIGGDGSLRGAEILSKKGVAVIGMPGTIDNDIAHTDYTIGFDTALNTVLDAVSKIRDTAISHERIAIIEVMGRNSGYLALYAGLAVGAESILVPEKENNIETLCQRLVEKERRGKLYSIILVAEGVANGFEVAKLVKDRTGFDPRVTILGYTQRGGSPSAFDSLLASRMGARAVDLLLQGKTNQMVAIEQGEIKGVDIRDVLNQRKELNWEIYELAGILAT